MKFPKFLPISLALLCAAPAFAQLGDPDDEPQSDSRVRKALDDLDLNYEVDSDGDFRLIMSFDDDRSQLLWVNSNTETLGSMEIREVWSFAFKADEDEPISRKRLEYLLQQNAQLKMGAWQPSSNGRNVIFCATVSARASGDALRQAIRLVAISADELEKDWANGTDDL